MKIPFSPPKIYDEIIEEVIDTLKSGWITTGPKTKAFEKEITKYCGNKKTLCVASATAGLEIILRWFGIQEGDEVIIPSYTYCATANVVTHCGATPVMVDINPDDFNISIQAIKNATTSKTKAIIPVDFAGLPCDYSQINDWAGSEQMKKMFSAKTAIQQKLGRPLILSDAAHSFGAKIDSIYTGALTDISVFSFHAVKNLTTAEGGAIALNLPDTFNHEEIYKLLNTKILHGQSKDALAKTKAGAWEYDVLEPGFKANMTDIQASLGLVEIKHYKNETLVRRKEIVALYDSLLSVNSWSEIPILKTSQKTSSFHLYPLRIKGISADQRNTLITKLAEEQISTNVHFKPLPLLTAYKKRGYNISDYPNALENFQREISLPIYYNLSDEQVKHLVSRLIFHVNQILTCS